MQAGSLRQLCGLVTGKTGTVWMPQGLGVPDRRRLPLLFSLNVAVVAAREHPAGGRAASDSQGHRRPNAGMEGGKELLLVHS